jgi:hypothetical protein
MPGDRLGSNPMGKAAENERIKLRATWFNNLSVGLTVAGVLVPYLALPQRFPEIGRVWEAYREGTQIQTSDANDLLSLLAAFSVALIASIYFRFRADAEIARLKED